MITTKTNFNLTDDNTKLPRPVHKRTLPQASSRHKVCKKFHKKESYCKAVRKNKRQEESKEVKV
jgi:hypothetical protein